MFIPSEGDVISSFDPFVATSTFIRLFRQHTRKMEKLREVCTKTPCILFLSQPDESFCQSMPHAPDGT